MTDAWALGHSAAGQRKGSGVMGQREERRNGRRIDLRRAAVLVNSDGVECKALVLDISSGGIRMSVDEPLSIGELVTLRAASREEFYVRISWALGSEVGGILLDPIDDARLR